MKDQEQFHSFFEHSPVAYQLLDECGCYLAVNARLCELLGYPQKELLGRSFADFWLPEYRTLFPLELAIFKQKGSIQWEINLITKSRVQITVLLEGRAEYDSQKNFLQAHCVLYNVTDRKRAETKLAYLSTFQQILLQLSAKFVNTGEGSLNSKINTALLQIGEFCQVDRAYVFVCDQQQKTTSNTNEWCAEGISAEIDNLQAIPYELVLPEWMKALQEHRQIYIPSVNDLPDSWHLEKGILAQQNIKSLIVKALQVDGEVLGFVGFDSVRQYRVWSIDEINLLEFLANILAESFKRQQMEEALRNSETRFRGAFEYTSVGMSLITLNRKFIRVNAALCRFFGYSESELLNLTFDDLTHPEDLYLDLELIEQVLANSIAYYHFEKRYIHRNRQVVWGLLSISLVRDHHQNPLYFVCQIQNITQQKQAEEKLRRANHQLQNIANTDGLTGVGNRRLFDIHLEQQWQTLRIQNLPLSLILFDVDYFKAYNDYYGHQKGDECLITIAQKTQDLVRSSGDTVARYGGEEFAVILSNSDLRVAVSVAERIRSAIECLSIPHLKSKVAEIVTVSLGVASLTPEQTQTHHTLIDLADQALYTAKQSGRNRYAIA